MTQKTPTRSGADKSLSREDRLKAALKANMAKRKAQARARADTGTGTEADKAGKSEG